MSTFGRDNLKLCIKLIESQPPAYWVGLIKSLENTINGSRAALGLPAERSIFEALDESRGEHG